MIKRIDKVGRYIEDETFRTVTLVAACLGFFLIALIGIRGEDTRSEATATKADVAVISAKLNEAAELLSTNQDEVKIKQHQQTLKIDDIKQNLANIQDLLRSNGLTP